MGVIFNLFAIFFASVVVLAGVFALILTIGEIRNERKRK